MRDLLKDFYLFTEDNRLYVFFTTYFVCEMIIIIVKSCFIGINTIIKTCKNTNSDNNTTNIKSVTK